MRFVVISHAPLVVNNNKWYGYAPYIWEMNLWMKFVSETVFICPILIKDGGLSKELTIQDISVDAIPSFSLLGIKNVLKSLNAVIICAVKIRHAMRTADHIHLRCPGNIGFIGCIIQIFYPKKKKTTKYAGNWDKKSRQPLSYKLQKWILNNRVLSKNMKVMVYGNWPDSSKNVITFFTASYSEELKLPISSRDVKQLPVKLIFVGTLNNGKQPLLSVKIAEQLYKNGFIVQLDIFGDGPLKQEIENYIIKHGLSAIIKVHGNQTTEVILSYYQKAHFLIFLSQSEGWPKVVAEAMWWGCLPVTTNVSCVSDMLGHGTRGSVIEPTIKSGVDAIEFYLNNPDIYAKKVLNAIEWSRQYTIEKFEAAIAELVTE